MIVLDTNVVSELMRRDPDPAVLDWVDGFAPAEVFLTAVTTAELRYGVARLPEGQRKRALHAAVDKLLSDDFHGQVLSFDDAAAAHYADIVAGRDRAGRPISMADGQIAAICRAWGAELATRNLRDFHGTGVTAVDPWRPATGG